MRTLCRVVLVASVALFVASGATGAASVPGRAARCKSDLDGNGVVDIFDLVVVAAGYNPTGPASDPRADANGDGVVNLFDLVCVSSNYGRGTALTPPPTVTPTLPAATGPYPFPGQCEQARVDWVKDGDTVVVWIGGREEEVRYVNIDAPESSEPYGSAATAANTGLVLGQTVCLETDPNELRDRDSLGRLLRYVWVGNVLAESKLVESGLARVVSYRPGYKYESWLRQLQAEATRLRLGLWAPRSGPTVAPPAGQVCDCAYNRYNCQDFATHAAAQACFNYCWQVRGFDVHRLDGDGDGSACEALP